MVNSDPSWPILKWLGKWKYKGKVLRRKWTSIYYSFFPTCDWQLLWDWDGLISQGLVMWGIISVFPWIGDTLAFQEELPPGSCVQLPKTNLCLAHQDSDWCARWPWQTVDASYSYTSLPRPQSKPADMTAFLLYLPKCFCAKDSHYWGGNWPVCSREEQTLII